MYNSEYDKKISIIEKLKFDMDGPNMLEQPKKHQVPEQKTSEKKKENEKQKKEKPAYLRWLNERIGYEKASEYVAKMSLKTKANNNKINIPLFLKIIIFILMLRVALHFLVVILQALSTYLN